MIGGVFAIVYILLHPYPEVSMTHVTSHRQVETISGKAFAAIQAALPEIARYDLNVMDYNIKVISDGQRLVVIFADPNISPGVKGSGGEQPGVEVLLDIRDLRIISSHLIR